MKYIIFLKLTAAVLLYSSCVQKTYTKTVVYTLRTAANKTNITSVGIKGKDKPLSWKKMTNLSPSKNDSTVYTTTVTYKTGYTFTEVKFVVNDTMEFQDADNRRVNFDTGDTTFYNATFNVVNKN